MDIIQNTLISRLEIITELRRVYFAYFENTPMEFKKFLKHSNISYFYITKHFGTWKNALNQAEINCTSRRPTRHTKNSIIAAIWDVSFEYFENRTMSFENFCLYSKIRSRRIIKHFGSWENALNQAEIKYRSRPPLDSKKSILAELRRVYFEQFENNIMSFKNFHKHSNVGYHYIIKHFGSWENALNQAEIKYNSKSIYIYHNEESTIAAIRQVYFEHFENTLMTVENFCLHSKISYHTVRSHFGSWENALKRAEIKYTSKKFTAEQKRELILDELYRIKAHNQGTYFTYAEYKEKNGRYDKTKIISSFEYPSWNKLLEKELNLYEKQKTPLIAPIVYTERQLFSELKRVWEKYGRRPTYSEFRNNTTIPITIYEKKFKTWGMSIEKFCSKNNGYNSYENSRNPQTSETKLLQELKNLKKEHQRTTLTFKEYQELGGKHTIITFRDYFGNWEKAIKLVGLKPARYKNNSPNSIELLQELQKIMKNLGRKPTPKEIKDMGKYPFKYYKMRFGSVKKGFIVLADRKKNVL